jgi:hypothetical protein
MRRLSKLLDSRFGAYLVGGSGVSQYLILQEAYEGHMEAWQILVIAALPAGFMAGIRSLRGHPLGERLAILLKIVAALHLLMAALAIGHLARVSYPALFALMMIPGIAAAILSLVERFPGPGSAYDSTLSSKAERNEPIE